HNIKFEDIIGKNVTVSIILADGDKRFFNGIISSFSQGSGGGETGGDPHFSHYTATMVPWFWLLTRTADSRIFQKLSVPDIVEKIFTEKEFLDYKLLLNDSYEKRDYCVQYRETDFNFISRLLEEEGICYFFEHEEKKHTLILADASDKFKPCPKQESARYQISAGGWLEEDVITSMEKMQEIRPAKYSINDFNFEIPGTDMKVDVSTKQMLGPGEREIYDYPGLYTKKAQGERLTTIRMEEEETKITTITGSSDCRAFTSGYRFDLLEYFREDMNNKPYVLVSVNHGATEPVGGSGQESGQSYTNSFTCIPFDVTYRPPRLTPKPVVEGAQTAIVVGPAGEEIYPDEHGRVKVQFHWDREGTNDENSSCWIRVSQVWAGAGWGAMHIPRIGQEVIVGFLEGDPDRPIITGRVYHGTNTPPYSLPDEKTKSTIKSDSSLGGGGSNEIRFEDKKGEEEIYLHGQKDWTIAIENDKNQTVGHDETLSVGNDKTIEIGANHTESIGANMSIRVGKNKTETVTINTAETIGVAKELTIGGAYQVSVGAAMNETVGGAKMEEVGAFKGEAVGGNKSETIGGNKSETIGGSKSLSTGKGLTEKVGKSQSVEITENLDEKVGGKHIEQVSKEYAVNAKKIQLMAEDQIVLKTGKAEIVMKKNGDIMIKGKKIQIKGSGDVIIKGSKIKEN
ncbi:MAG: type VI secretion system tip protein VgrG, partial [Deltaproteobacteria bacterium]|nr:type VI secretion system tip protein VgrG [Deltaproteobacteria bacterium]